MDAPAIREELRDMARRFAAVGYYVMLPNLYYREGVMEIGALSTDPKDPTRIRMTELMNTLSIRMVLDDFDAMLDFAAKALLPTPGTVRATVGLPNASAQLVRAPGVLPADGRRRVVLYLHGGGFLTCGVNSHSRISVALSKFADSPVLVVDYRLIPKHSVGQAIDDCHDGYRWLRLRGYEPDQIVLAGDSAGGYLALALAQRLQAEGEKPAALVAISPLLQLEKDPKCAHPNIHSDAMFPPKAFDALVALVARAAAKNIVDGKPEDVYEPLEHIEPGLPQTMIHVSGSEVLLHDARLAAKRLAAAGVPTEVRVWPGQIHDFQMAAPLIPEATRSLRQIGEYIREATG